MSIDIKAKQIEPIRQTYGHVARRIGEGKAASRYEEATYDLQAVANFHYRPTWRPNTELFDASLTQVEMADWYTLLDPRKHYYATYCNSRASWQESVDQNYKLVEKKGLIELLDAEIVSRVTASILPLRHYEWGANMNNCQICADAYGSAIASPAMFHAADRLGNAQYITRIGLAFSNNESEILDSAKQSWMEADHLQGLRKLVEDSLVVDDWFELFVVQNLVMDAYVHTLCFGEFEGWVNQNGGTAYSMLTELIGNWYQESSRWVDKQIAVVASESTANADKIKSWVSRWQPEAVEAVKPLARSLIGDESVIETLTEMLTQRLQKIGIEG